MKTLFTLKIFLIVAFINGMTSRGVSDNCSAQDTCESCANEGCYWVTLSNENETSLCYERLSDVGDFIIQVVIPGSVKKCKEYAAENTSHYNHHQVGYYNNSNKNNHAQAQSILSATQTKIDSAKLFFYKRKNLISLKFLNDIIPRIQFLQHNMTALVHEHPENEPMSSEIENYKIVDTTLDTDLLAIEDDFQQNRVLLKEYMDAYQNLEEQMKFLKEALQRGVGSN